MAQVYWGEATDAFVSTFSLLMTGLFAHNKELQDVPVCTCRSRAHLRMPKETAVQLDAYAERLAVVVATVLQEMGVVGVVVEPGGGPGHETAERTH